MKPDQPKPATGVEIPIPIIHQPKPRKSADGAHAATPTTGEHPDRVPIKEFLEAQPTTAVAGQATGEWTLGTVYDLLDYQRRNVQAVVDAHNAALAATRMEAHDYWSRAVDAAQKELAAEREKGFREAAKLYKPARDDDRREIQQLREQLAAAQAAIVKARKRTWAMAEKWPELESIDTAALDVATPAETCPGVIEQAIAAAQQPLVELLLEAWQRLGNTAFPSLSARIAAALAKAEPRSTRVKEGK